MDSTFGDGHDQSGMAVLCRCLTHNDDARGTLEQLCEEGPAEWERSARLAQRSGLAPLLYHRLSQLGLAAALPDDAVRSLRLAYLKTAALNTRLYHRLGIVLRELRRRSIPAIVLKGAYLAEAVYGNVGLRPMGDMDVLVRLVDIECLEGVLAGAGLHPLTGWSELDVVTKRHVNYASAGGEHFEFHHDLLPTTILPAHFDLDALWAAAVETEIAGEPALALSPPDLLLHLCAHLFVHVEFWGLRGLCDISETIHHFGPKMDWPAVISRSRRGSLDRCVYLALRATEALLEVPLPDGLLSTLQPAGMPQSALATILERATTTDNVSRPAPFLQLWGHDSFDRKMARLKRTLFLPRWGMAAIYGVPPDSPLILLCYPRRWLHWLGRARAMAPAMLRGDSGARDHADRYNRWAALREYLFHSE